MAETPVKFVLFDAGGTLLGTNVDSEFWYEQFFVDACAEQGCKVSIGEVHDVLKRAARSRQFDSRCSSDKQAREFWLHIYTAAFSDLLGVHASYRTPAFIQHLAADYIDRFEDGEFIRLFPDARPTLEVVKSLNIPMGIVSNFSSYLNDFLKKLEITDYFQFVLTSAEEGCEKPGAEIFQRALKKCGDINQSNVLYVGDNPEEDCLASKACGMQALLIDRHNRNTAFTEAPRIKSLAEISAYLS